MFEVFERLQVGDETFVAFGRRPDDCKNYGQLVIGAEWEPFPLLGRVFGRREWEAGLAGEKRLSVHESRRIFTHHAEQFSENAANSPDIDSWAVILFE